MCDDSCCAGGEPRWWDTIWKKSQNDEEELFRCGTWAKLTFQKLSLQFTWEGSFVFWAQQSNGAQHKQPPHLFSASVNPIGSSQHRYPFSFRQNMTLLAKLVHTAEMIQWKRGHPQHLCVGMFTPAPKKNSPARSKLRNTGTWQTLKRTTALKKENIQMLAEQWRAMMVAQRRKDVISLLSSWLQEITQHFKGLYLYLSENFLAQFSEPVNFSWHFSVNNSRLSYYWVCCNNFINVNMPKSWRYFVIYDNTAFNVLILGFSSFFLHICALDPN